LRNFQHIESGLDVIPLMSAVLRMPLLWNSNTLRTTHEGTAHQDVDDIWLRFNDLSRHENVLTVVNDHESINYPAFWALPMARPLVFGLMARVAGERLGRVLITRLPPGKRIVEHIDAGTHAEYYDRFHIALNGLPGSLFHCGGETVQMLTGECWWLNNCVEHEIINNSAGDRVHMVVDIRTSR